MWLTMDNQIVTIVSGDNDEVIVHRRAAMLNSEHLRMLLAFCQDERIYLNIDTQALSAVVNFMEQNLLEPLELNPGNFPPGAFLSFEMVVPQVWYRMFCQDLSLNTKNFQRVGRAASYLGINHLSQLLELWSSFEQLNVNSRPKEPDDGGLSMDDRLLTLFPDDIHDNLGFFSTYNTEEEDSKPFFKPPFKGKDEHSK